MSYIPQYGAVFNSFSCWKGNWVAKDDAPLEALAQNFHRKPQRSWLTVTLGDTNLSPVLLNHYCFLKNFFIISIFFLGTQECLPFQSPVLLPTIATWRRCSWKKTTCSFSSQCLGYPVPASSACTPRTFLILFPATHLSMVETVLSPWKLMPP